MTMLQIATLATALGGLYMILLAYIACRNEYKDNPGGRSK